MEEHDLKYNCRHTKVGNEDIILCGGSGDLSENDRKQIESLIKESDNETASILKEYSLNDQNQLRSLFLNTVIKNSGCQCMATRAIKDWVLDKRDFSKGGLEKIIDFVGLTKG